MWTALFRKRWKFIAWLLVILGAALRFEHFFDALQYDEIWTLASFVPRPVSEIFTQLSLPNNHPLNSLLMKMMITLYPENYLIIRVPAFLAGILSVPFAGLLAFYLFRRRSAVLWTMFFMALSAPLALYSQIARGYSIQVFLCILFGIGLMMLGKRRPKKYKYLPEILLLFSGISAILTLPTSILIMTPAALLVLIPGYRLWKNHKKEYLPTVLAGILGSAFVLYWFLSNFEQMRQAQTWGAKVESAAQYFQWLFTVFDGITTPGIILLVILGFIFAKSSRKLFFIIAFPLIAAIFTNLGPVRAYFVLIPLLSLAAAAGTTAMIRLLKYRCNLPKLSFIFGILAATAAAYGYYTQRPEYIETDYHRLHKDVQNLPKNHLVIFQSNRTLPILCYNHPDAYNDYFSRFNYTAGAGKVIFLDKNAVNGAEFDGNEIEIYLPPSSGSPFDSGCVKGYEHNLIPLRNTPKTDEIVFVFIGPSDNENQVSTAEKEIRNSGKNNWLLLNTWLTRSHFMLLATKITEDSDFNPQELKDKFPGLFRFYYLDLKND